MILFIDWRLTLIALIPLPLLAVTSRVLGSKLHDAFRDSQEAFSSINDKTQESITGIKVIKTFGQEKEDLADFEEKIEDAIIKNKRVNFLDSLFDPFITLIIGLSYVATIILGGKYVLEGTISMGRWSHLLAISVCLFGRCLRLVDCSTYWKEEMLLMIASMNFCMKRRISWNNWVQCRLRQKAS